MGLAGCWRVALLSGLSCGAWLILPSQAEPIPTDPILPDQTLGAESSQVVPVGEGRDRIEAGAIRGSNLFHSFDTFNINADHTVYFANPSGITDIFSRVTGSSRSDIFGTLGVSGNANLFLLNPNGILFGPGAKLDISGSFVGTTANALTFGDSLIFSATHPQAAPLLNVSLAPGLQWENSSQSPEAQALAIRDDNTTVITSQAELSAGNDLRLEAQRLDVQGTLQAEGDLTLRSLDSAQIQDSATQPLIARAGGDLVIQGDRQVQISALSHPDSKITAGGDLSLRSGNPVEADAHFSSGGNFAIQQLDQTLGALKSPNDPVIRAGGDVSFTDYTGPSLHVIAGGSVNADSITITGAAAGAENIDFLRETVTLSDGDALLIDGGARPTLDVRAGVRANAIGGALNVSGDTSGFIAPPTDTVPPTNADIDLETVSFEAPNGQVLLSTQYQPNETLTGGSVRVGRILVDDRSGTLFNGDAADVTIDSRQDFVVRDRVDASAANGSPGDLNIIVAGDTQLDQSYLVTNNNGSSAPGNINIQTGNLTALNGSQLRISTAGFADAGKVTIEASGDVTFDDLLPGNVFRNTQEDRAGIDNRILDTGLDDEPLVKSGGILINARNITLSNGAQFQVRVDERATGESGDIRLNAEDTIAIDGVSPEDVSQPGASSSGLITSVEFRAEGTAGDAILQAREVLIREGGSIQLNTQGVGDAGNVQITASERIQVIGKGRGRQSVIQTRINDVGRGNAGDITLEAPVIEIAEEAFVRSNSEAERRDSGGGNGGNITITAPVSLTIRDDAQIRTNVEDNGSFAGDISIETGRLEMRDDAKINAFADGALPNPINPEQVGGGDIRIVATESVLITDDSEIIAAQGDDSIGGAGDISIESREIAITDDSKVRSESEGEGGAGNITLIATDGAIRIDDESAVRATLQVRGLGSAGDIRLEAATVVEITNDSAVLASSEPNENDRRGRGRNDYGNAGSVTIIAPERVSLINDGLLATSVDDRGSFAGDVTVRTGVFEVKDGSRIFAGADGRVLNPDPSGPQGGGNVDIIATESAQILDESLIRTQQGDDSIGDAGDISIEAPVIDILDEAQIVSRSEGEGNGGKITLRATEQPIRISNNSEVRSSLDVRGIGIAGDILVEAPVVEISNSSSVLASAEPNFRDPRGRGYSDQGNAGKVTIIAPERVSLFNEGEIRTSVDEKGSFAGDVTIRTGQFEIRENSVIEATANGEIINEENPNLQGGGDVNIIATESVKVDQSQILARLDDDAIGNAGNILIDSPDVNISNSSEVSSVSDGMGNGGGITLQTDGGNINLNRSKIKANLETDGVGEAGNILLDGDQILIAGPFGNVESRNRGEGKGGDITLRGNELGISGLATITSSIETTGTGEAGNILVDVNTLDVDESSFQTNVLGEGKAGNVTIDASESIRITSSPNAILTRVNEGATGEGGKATITTPNFELLQGSRFVSNTEGTGPAGAIELNVTEEALIDGELGPDDFFFSEDNCPDSCRSGLFSTVTDTAIGAESSGGQITVTGNRFTLSNEGRIDASTLSEGEAGRVRVDVNSLSLDRDGQISSSTGAAGDGGNIEVESDRLSLSNRGRIDASTSGQGQAGQVGVMVGSLEVNSAGQISSSTSAGGDGGNVTVEARDDITLSGEESGLFAIGEAGSAGDSGNISVTGTQVNIQEGAQISISVQEGTEGDGGNVNVTASRALVMRDQGLIATDSRGDGNGGNVNINAPFLIGLPQGNSDIIANARQGSGGNIDIEANAILNFQQQDDPDTDRLRANGTNDISASSEFGSSGNLSLAGLDVDPSRGTAQLPVAPASNDQVDRTCSAQATASNSFTVTGRGGLPLSPNEPPSEPAAPAQWVSLPQSANAAQPLELQDPVASPTEAVEWQQNAAGQVNLVAQGNRASLPQQDCQLKEDAEENVEEPEL